MTLTTKASLKSATVFSAAGAVAYGMMLIVLDVAIAGRYGTGTQAAVYQAAYIIPTMLIGMLSGGAILGSFVPPFVRLGGLQRNAGAATFLRSSLVTVLAVLAVIAFALIWIAPLLANAVASGFDAPGREDVARTLRIMLLMVIPHGVAYVYAGALMAIGRVGPANVAPVLIPLAGLATFPWWGAENGAEMVGIGYVVGALAMAAILAIVLRQERFKVAPSLSDRSPERRQFFESYVFSSFAYGALASVLLVNQAFAGNLSARELAGFSFGTKLVTLALAFFSTVVNGASLPYFSAMSDTLLWPKVRNFMVRVFAITAVAALIWIALSRPIVELIYARGQFTTEDAELAASVQRVFLVQAPFYAVGLFCWRMINAIGRWQPLLVASVLALAVDLMAVAQLRLQYQSPGIAAAHSLSVAVWAFALVFFLRRSLHRASTQGKP